MSDKFYRVITHKSNEFEIFDGSETLTVKARGKLKREGEILVGDFVTVEEKNGETVIKTVKKRENSLIRPAVANIDAIVLVVATQPKIDYFLVDKMIINCKRMGIECIICLNKSDLSREIFDELTAQYKNEVSAIVAVSALNNEQSELYPYIKDKLVCFAGQSGVGKSTLTNSISGTDREVGKVSEKIGRGKNTTTSASIIITPSGLWIIDTPGFSMLDVFEEDYRTLAGYYDEYVSLADGCKFHPCTHTSEPDCKVKQAVESGLLNKDRYERYLKIFEEQKIAYKNAVRR